MFKSWRSEKKKIKAVFKLQFQATQVPRLKKSALMISLVPEDVGKPTFKLEKVAVQDGTCSWENPIFVSVKLIREPKTGKLNEKIYHFIVATGSSKSGFLGEASIDFADFAAETQPLTVSLPLKFANSGAVLHVTIQMIQSGTDQRYIEENGDPTLSDDGSLKRQQSNHDTDADNQNFAEDAHFNTTTPKNDEQNGSFRGSIGSNATLASCQNNGSGTNTHQDLGLKKTDEDPTSYHSPHQQNSMPQRTVDAITSREHSHRRSNTDWSVGSASDGSFIESTNSPDDNFRRGWQEDSNDSIEKLKSEIATLMRQAEVSELEMQSLRKQVLKESKRTQDLSRQIISLTEEKDALYRDCKLLKLQKQTDDAEAESRSQSVSKDSRILLEEIREELNCEKDFNSTLRLQLQRTQDSNSNLILAVRDLNEMLEEKSREISCLSSKLESSKKFEEVQKINSKCNMKEDEHQLALRESTKEPNDAEEIDVLKQTITDLYGEIEFYSKHKEELEMQLKQLMQDYEILKTENHDISSKLEQRSDSLGTIKELEFQVQRLEDKIKQQSLEYSESLIAINELESQVKGLKKELEEQARVFEDDLDATIHAKTEQEQRAIRAEETLRKTRWNNAITAERLQEEFKKLSVEMASKLDENEKLARKAVAEANELRMQKTTVEEMLQKANKELKLIKDQNEVKLEELSSQIESKAKRVEQMSLELDNKSKQVEYAQKRDGERHAAFSMEIQMLRAEIEKLNEEKNEFFKHAEENAKVMDAMDQTKTEIGETEMLIQRWNKERNDWEKKNSSAKKEAKKAQEQLIVIRSLKDGKETMIRNLQSKVENLSLQYNELKNRFIEEEMEKESLRKQVFQIKGELQKKEEDITIVKKKLKNNSCQAAISDVNKTTSNNSTSVVPSLMLLARKEETRSEKELKATSTTSKEGNLAKLLDELEIFKERNKSMESELKEMQERYSEISLKFAEVEGERQQLVMTVRNLKNGKKN